MEAFQKEKFRGQLQIDGSNGRVGGGFVIETLYKDYKFRVRGNLQLDAYPFFYQCTVTPPSVGGIYFETWAVVNPSFNTLLCNVLAFEMKNI
eukprot:Em0003g1175a